MKKALGYARVSGKSQETDGTGLDEQVAQVTEWATRNGYEIVAWFKDSITGELPWDERPAMKALVERLALNGIDAVLVHQLDRVARGKSGIFESFFDVAQAAGVQVISTIDGVLTDVVGDEFKSADAEMIRSIKQAIVRQEKRKLVARMALGKLRNKAKGKHTDGVHAYGEHPSLEYDSEKAIVEKIKEMHASGTPLHRIAQHLTYKGIRTRLGKEFKAQQIKNILDRGKEKTK